MFLLLLAPLTASLTVSRRDARESPTWGRFRGGATPRGVLVNLPQHNERFKGAKAELKRAGVKFDRIDAVDGRLLSAAEWRANVTLLGRTFLTTGTVGCYLSHRRCWEECVRRNEVLLIFEDDVLLCDNFSERLDSAMASLPEDWWDAST